MNHDGRQYRIELTPGREPNGVHGQYTDYPHYRVVADGQAIYGPATYGACSTWIKRRLPAIMPLKGQANELP